MANALGSGLVETPALLAYLPGLCRELLGEDLKLPWARRGGAASPIGLGHVLAKLPRMVIKPTFARRRFEPIFADRLEPRAARGAGRPDPRPARRLRRPGADRAVLGPGDARRPAPVRGTPASASS